MPKKMDLVHILFSISHKFKFILSRTIYINIEVNAGLLR